MRLFRYRSCFRRTFGNLLIAAIAFWAPWAASQVVALRETAEVEGPVIQLSDLLATSAPRSLREASAAIDVGRSPQPGSVRILEAGQVGHALSRRPDLLRQISIPDRILIRRCGWTVKREAIREVIGKFLRVKSESSNLPDSALQAPGDIFATEKNPVLEVAEMVRDVRGHGSEFRLRCVPRGRCSSFVVHVGGLEISSLGWADGLHTTFDKVGFSRTAPVAPKANGPVMAGAGSKAMLLLDGGRMTISLPVVCLESGRLLQTIRVLDAGSHRVLRGEIVGAGKLHASL